LFFFDLSELALMLLNDTSGKRTKKLSGEAFQLWAGLVRFVKRHMTPNIRSRKARFIAFLEKQTRVTKQ